MSFILAGIIVFECSRLRVNGGQWIQPMKQVLHRSIMFHVIGYISMLAKMAHKILLAYTFVLLANAAVWLFVGRPLHTPIPGIASKESVAHTE